MRGLIRRSLRHELVAALGIALALPALAFAAQNIQPVATQTTLTVETHDHAGRTTATLAIAVLGDDSLPGAGAVSISDRGRALAGVALDKEGRATLNLALPVGSHSLTAAYTGDPSHSPSVSPSVSTEAQTTTTTPDFQVSVAPATLSIPVGQSKSVTVSITPENASALTAPMFVTLSCSGLPDQSACVFNPENIEILPNATKAITSSMVVSTQQQEGSNAHRANGIALAILFPGALALGGLAWSVRRRPWLQRLSLLALVALAAMLGTTSCNARYNYFNHGPPPNPATPAGTYTVDVVAQSSDGVTATTHFTTLALTVQ